MQAPSGGSLRFLSIRAHDRFKVPAALWQPENKPLADTTMIVQVHGSGGSLAWLPLRMVARTLSVAAQHFLTYRDEQTSAADGTYWIPRIPRPILILRDEADGLPLEPYMVLSAARAKGSLAPSIEYVLLPNIVRQAGKAIIRRQHVGADRSPSGPWLAEQHL